MTTRADELVQSLSQPTQPPPDKPTRLDTFRAQLAEIDLVDTLRARARQAFDTGNPDQSATCITEHLTDVEFASLREVDRFWCPECGHKIKDRVDPGGRG